MSASAWLYVVQLSAPLLFLIGDFYRGVVQLTDFGLSRTVAEVAAEREKAAAAASAGSEAHEDGVVRVGGKGTGSLPWMAPEMIAQEYPTPAADAFRYCEYIYLPGTKYFEALRL